MCYGCSLPPHALWLHWVQKSAPFLTRKIPPIFSLTHFWNEVFWSSNFAQVKTQSSKKGWQKVGKRTKLPASHSWSTCFFWSEKRCLGNFHLLGHWRRTGIWADHRPCSKNASRKKKGGWVGWTESWAHWKIKMGTWSLYTCLGQENHLPNLHFFGSKC